MPRTTTIPVGTRFGRWVTVGPVERVEGDKEFKVLCLCDCDTKSRVVARRIAAGQNQSCGCAALEAHKGRAITPVGEVFGRWTVTGETFWDDRGRAHAPCTCSCGTAGTPRVSQLKKGTSSSCGCLGREHQKHAARERRDKTPAGPEARTNWLIGEKSGPCTDCGVNYPLWCMQLDHCPELGKKIFNVNTASIATHSITELKEERAKCELVCSNCHDHRTFLRSRKLPLESIAEFTERIGGNFSQFYELEEKNRRFHRKKVNEERGIPDDS